MTTSKIGLLLYQVSYVILLYKIKLDGDRNATVGFVLPEAESTILNLMVSSESCIRSIQVSFMDSHEVLGLFLLQVAGVGNL